MMRRTHLVVLLATVLIAFALGFAFVGKLPNPAPVHWNVRGEADGFGSPWTDAMLMPAILAALAALLIVLPLLGPFRENFERFAGTYGRIAVTMGLGLLAIHVVILLKASGHAVPIDRALPCIVGLLMAALGNWMGKVRRNFFVGIRTPWTLANDRVWEMTHRLGGRLMAGYGLVTAAAAVWLPPLVTLVVLLAGALGLVAWALVYSCQLYHRLGVTDDLSR